jgi:hypothetical protein
MRGSGTWRGAGLAVAGLVATALTGMASPGGAAAPPDGRGVNLTPPDMRMLVLRNAISIGVDGGTRYLHFSHVTSDLGRGPFEIDPSYDSSTGVATFTQALYGSPSPGRWRFDHRVPVAAVGVFHPPADYDFPLTSFTLLDAQGNVVGRSPKTDYCITADYFVGGLVNEPDHSFIDANNCGDPTKRLGWSIGWGDHYDQTDDGQPIDIDALPNGTYTLRGIVDPEHVLTESDPANNVTDTRLTIQDTSVTVGAQTHPDLPLPKVQITSPGSGARVGGTVTLTARASTPVGRVRSVQFLVDGVPVGAADTTAPYSVKWRTGNDTPGRHFVSARVTRSQGIMNTARSVPVTLTTRLGSMAVDRNTSALGTTTATVRHLSTSRRGELLLAMVGADGPLGQQVRVSGGGLSWTLVRRAHGQPGDAEVWRARVPQRLRDATVRASAAQSGFHVWLNLLALQGASGTGTSKALSTTGTPPAVELTAARAGAVGVAVGNDYDAAAPRVVGTNQRLLAERRDSTGDTYWSQGTRTGALHRGDVVRLDDTAPTGDRVNFVGVQVLPPRSTGRSAPSVALLNPVPDQEVSGTVPLAARVTDDAPVAAVRFLVDGHSVGVARRAPYAVAWDTTSVPTGPHVLTVVAEDANGQQAMARRRVEVQNPAAPMTCFVVQSRRNAQGYGAVSTRPFRTAVHGEVLLAMVSADGPRARRQSAGVRGGGLTWHLVARSNSQQGDAEVWAAHVDRIGPVGPVTSRLARAAYAQHLTVIALEGVDGVGATTVAGEATGRPHASLAVTGPDASLVFAVGNAAVARRPVLPTGQIFAARSVLRRAHATFWSQYTNQAVHPTGTRRTMQALRPVGAPWNLVAVEAVGDEE